MTVFVLTHDRKQSFPDAPKLPSAQLNRACSHGYVGRLTARHGGVTWWRVVAARSRVRYRPTS
ncbi:hypothetical protein GPN2_11172 [Streptomyces murinus]